MAETKTKTKKIRKESTGKAVIKRLGKNRTAVFGLIVFVILALLAIFSTIINPYVYDAMSLKEKNQSPSADHWFGTDDLGRDIMSRVLYGGRYSLSIGLLAIIAALAVGVFIGAISGFFGGWVDNIIMRILDIIQAVPGMLMTIAISTALGTGFTNTVLALALSRIPQFARVLRAQVLSTRTQEYVEAAQAIGCSNARRIVKYVLPNSFAPVLVSATMGVANTILMLASLSYIGLGVQPPTPEWGAMLSAARPFIREYPYQLVFPGIFIGLAVLALNLFGDGLRDALDPKLKD